LAGDNAGMLLYFAYGSNMDRALMRANCPSAKPVGIATLDDHRFIIAACGYASVQPRQGSIVHGVMWRITPRDGEALDRYERISSRLYDREMLPVRMRGSRASALVYVACARGLGRAKPGYLERVLAAAQDWQLPENHISEIARWRAPQGTVA
jgi:hypothetical protein